MTSHRECTHPATKAARTLCRKFRATYTEPAEGVEARPLPAYVTDETEAARLIWESERCKFAEGHILSAETNADDTSVEDKFEPQSKRWYEVAVSTLHCARDDADRFDYADPITGHALRLRSYDDWLWVDKVIWANGEPFILVLVNRDGVRRKVTMTALMGDLDD